jgi:hypothetical protein
LDKDEIETRDHWWRPGWHPGRSFYTWHILVEDQPAIHEFAQQLQPELAATGAFGPIPLKWLHMTLQGVGFTDEVSDETLNTIAIAVGERVTSLGPVPVTLGPPVVDGGAARADPGHARPPRCHASCRSDPRLTDHHPPRQRDVSVATY